MWRILLVSFLISSLCGLETAQLTTDEQGYQRHMQPFLQQHCVACHGATKAKAGLRLDDIDTDIVQGTDLDLWTEVMDRLHLRDMPPKTHPQPSAAAYTTINHWLTEQMRLAAMYKRRAGASVMRRLSNEEYQATMGDLLGFSYDFTEGLPPDPQSHLGFSNDAQLLGLSAMQLETYYENAYRAVGEALGMVYGDEQHGYRIQLNDKSVQWRQPRAYDAIRNNPLGLTFYKAKRAREFYPREAFAALTQQQRALVSQVWVLNSAQAVDDSEGRGVWLGPTTISDGQIQIAGDYRNKARKSTPLARMVIRDYHRFGPVRVTVKAAGVAGADGKPPLMRVGIGFRSSLTVAPIHVLGDVQVRAEPDSPQAYVFHARMEDMILPAQIRPGRYQINVNMWHVDQAVRVKGKRRKQEKRGAPPRLLLQDVTFEGPIFTDSPNRSILFDGDKELSDTTYVRAVLDRFARRAWRRPLSDKERHALEQTYFDLFKRHGDAKEALRHVLAGVLSSPDFLYLVEKGRDAGARLDDYELAARLSYLLWGRAPDAQLRARAAAGGLGDTKGLRIAFERLLADARSASLARRFALQWWDLDAIDSVAINPAYYPQQAKHEAELKAAMRRETELLFEHVLHKNLSALRLFDADFTFVNGVLASQYAIDGVTGSAFQKVSLPASKQRKGVLGHASIHLLGSTGDTSHPIKRGMWILERLLLDPPPPPPAAVPDLPVDDPQFAVLPVARQLATHTGKASCKACHQKIDHFGLALEHYDAVGRWRPKHSLLFVNDKKHAIAIDTGRFPDGSNPKTAAELADYLLQHRRQDLVHSLVTHLLAFALGREVSIADRAAVEAIIEATVDQSHRLQDVLWQVVASDVFCNR